LSTNWYMNQDIMALATITSVKVTPMPTAVDFFWEVPKKTHRPKYFVNTKFLMIMAPRRTESRYPR
jgi:hypothetical protein